MSVFDKPHWKSFFAALNKVKMTFTPRATIDRCEQCKHSGIETECNLLRDEPWEEILFCYVEEVDVETLMEENFLCKHFDPMEGTK